MLGLGARSRLSEDDPQLLASQPGDLDVRLVEPGGDQQGVVGTPLKLHHDLVLVNRNSRRGVDEVAEQVAGLAWIPKEGELLTIVPY